MLENWRRASLAGAWRRHLRDGALGARGAHVRAAMRGVALLLKAGAMRAVHLLGAAIVFVCAELICRDGVVVMELFESFNAACRRARAKWNDMSCLALPRFHLNNNFAKTISHDLDLQGISCRSRTNRKNVKIWRGRWELAAWYNDLIIAD